MTLGWMDVSTLSINTLLLLERVQLSWWPGWNFAGQEREVAIALRANPYIEWYLRHKCPEITPTVDKLMSMAPAELPANEQIRRAEAITLQLFEDLVVYAVDPACYDRQPFLGWDSSELSGLTDFRNKTVIDVGAGTGRQSMVALQNGAAVVYAVEPVENLRLYLKAKARQAGYQNLFAVDGTITEIPFLGGFADVVMSGHVFGDSPEQEIDEMERVKKADGVVILIPGLSDHEDEWTRQCHQILISRGYEWGRFEEPQDGWKRKYWKSTRSS